MSEEHPSKFIAAPRSSPLVGSATPGPRSGPESWRTASASVSKPDRGSEPDRIDQLYTELRGLMDRADEEPELDNDIELRFEELRGLQRAEAAEMRRRFESRLHLAPGEGRRALHEARRLLGDR